jgi:hypothetical protein
MDHRRLNLTDARAGKDETGARVYHGSGLFPVYFETDAGYSRAQYVCVCVCVCV